MARVKLEDKLTETRTIEVTVREELYASKCDGCGKIFHMTPFCNDVGLSCLQGTFDACAIDPLWRKSMGNTFQAQVCSFLCAHEIFENGGWKKLPEYKPYADQGIPLARGSLTITIYRMDEVGIRKQWEKDCYRST